jgi:deoxyribonuclease V
MKHRRIHSWDVSPKEAFSIQESLREMLVPQGELGKVRVVAGADVACPKGKGKAVGGVAVFSYPGLEIIEEAVAERELAFPYVPGLLAFREAPALLDAFEKLCVEPDVVLFDAQGYAHPRRMGLASHLGILLDKPSVGCAKSVLVGDYEEPENAMGSVAPLMHKNEVVGAAVRTRKGVKPVFVSVGHRVSLDSAIAMVISCCRGYKLPEPARRAHTLVTRYKSGAATPQTGNKIKERN